MGRKRSFKVFVFVAYDIYKNCYKNLNRFCLTVLSVTMIVYEEYRMKGLGEGLYIVYIHQKIFKQQKKKKKLKEKNLKEKKQRKKKH